MWLMGFWFLKIWGQWFYLIYWQYLVTLSSLERRTALFIFLWYLTGLDILEPYIYIYRHVRCSVWFDTDFNRTQTQSLKFPTKSTGFMTHIDICVYIDLCLESLLCKSIGSQVVTIRQRQPCFAIKYPFFSNGVINPMKYPYIVQNSPKARMKKSMIVISFRILNKMKSYILKNFAEN